MVRNGGHQQQHQEQHQHPQPTYPRRLRATKPVQRADKDARKGLTNTEQPYRVATDGVTGIVRMELRRQAR